MIPVATRRILVWDLSLRFFHWAFAAALGASLALALIGGKRSSLFSWHMLFGCAAGFLLLLRVAMGLVGSRYACFSRLPVGPARVIRYFREVFTVGVDHQAGHNPGSALAAVAMFLLVPLLITTGLGGSRDPWEEIHGALAYGLLGVIALHLLGLIWHRVRHGENIAMSMITGRKVGRPEDGLVSSHPVWALGCLLAAGAWIGSLFASYDAAASRVRLPLTGPTIQLSEGEGGGKAHFKQKRKHRHDD